MENVIEIKNLNKKYEDFSLNGITLDIPKGSIVGLIGENGACLAHHRCICSGQSVCQNF